MTERIAGGVAVLAVVVIGGYLIWQGVSPDQTPSEAPRPVAADPSITWAFDPAGTDENDIPLTAVSLVWEGKTFDVGTHQGNCFAIEGSAWELVPGEQSGAICWWAGGGTELGIFEEGGERVVKRGYLDEGTAEEEDMRGGFETVFVLKKTGDSTLVKTKIGKSEVGLGIRITPLEVLEDSRCPIDAVCIQAGTLRLKANVTVGGRTTEEVFTLGIVQTREHETLTLVAVEPAPRAAAAIPPANYVFTFGVEKRSGE